MCSARDDSIFGTIFPTPLGFNGNEKTMEDTNKANFPEFVEFSGICPINFAAKS